MTKFKDARGQRFLWDWGLFPSALSARMDGWVTHNLVAGQNRHYEEK